MASSTRSLVSWTSCAAFLLLQLLSAPVVHAWQRARATWYDDAPWMTVDWGSCGYGYIDKSRFPDYHVAALSESFPGFHGSCGKCYEIACDPMDFRDGFGEHLHRSGVCRDPGASIIVTITDSCPCNKPENAHSNKRWCCGDMNHMDVSVWAFEKLADLKWGVIGIKYREVPCGTKPAKPAQLGGGQWPTGRRSPQDSLSKYGAHNAPGYKTFQGRYSEVGK